jgi:signal transduction histidine kinase
MQRAVSNLSSNAVKYSNSGTTISVRLISQAIPIL